MITALILGVCLLNGEPIDYRAAEAAEVFLRSGLEHIALANRRVEKT